MKTFFTIVVIIIIICCFYVASKTKKTVMETNTNTVQVIPIEHASGILVWNDLNIYMDPVGAPEDYEGKPAADIILVTDIHGDHFSASILGTISDKAVIIAPQEVFSKMPAELARKTKVLKNGEELAERGFKITAIPMYNIPGKENENYHIAGRGNGYVIENEGYRVYIAGDTAGTPEMRTLTDIDIAFIPMNLPYTMSVEEAADAVLAFKPKTVYPYHYRNQGGLSDVNKFKELVNISNPNIEVIIGAWYPNQ